ncbi:MAG TPA: S8 family serine peptidase [Longimicrobium sp.]|nr:S8 family serine peptidase [Longimicrobium sp.]
MKRWLTLAACVVFGAACSDERSQPLAPGGEGASRLLGLDPLTVVDPVLTAALTLSAPTDRLEVFVTYDEAATTSDAVTAAVRGTGAGIVRFRHLPVVAAVATPAQVVRLSSLAGVRSLFINKRLSLHLAESVPTIRADLAQAAGYTGKGVGIAILDSGIDGLHSPDLRHPTRTVQNVKLLGAMKDLVTFDAGEPAVGADLFVENVATSETTTGHGTHVAGIAAGDGTASGYKYRGVAPGANLIGIGAGDGTSVFWTLAGFDYVLENQAKYNIQVVNNSWGISGGDFDPEDPVNVATKKLYGRGIAVVFSAGNDGPGENTMNPYSVAPWVFSVAAGCKTVSPDPTSSADGCAGGTSLLAGFSSRGRRNDGTYRPDIVAPGVHIVSARAALGLVINSTALPSDLLTCAIEDAHKPYYTCIDGTSMAAPHVTGTIALMEEASRGRLTPDQAYQALARSARPMLGYAPFEVGAGYLDAYAAVRAVRR